MTKPCLFLLALVLVASPRAGVSAQRSGFDSLRARIAAVSDTSRARVGVALLVLESGDTLTQGDGHRYPMQSVFKLPLAVAVLREVDAGRMLLDSVVRVPARDLYANTWSPLREKHPRGCSVTVRELLAYTVSHSDNNTCDILFRLMGGTARVQHIVREAGFPDIAIAATEQEMARAWDVQFTNWTHPSEMVRLLAALQRGTLLSEKSSAEILGMLTATSTGLQRIKGLLPPGTAVAHKTGSSGRSPEGVLAATNDVGIVTLPDGRHLLLAVFVADSRGTSEGSERVIAEIARMAYEHCASRGSER